MLSRVAAEGAGINKEESQAAESLAIPFLFLSTQWDWKIPIN
jgi:hypothetical protein